MVYVYPLPGVRYNHSFFSFYCKNSNGEREREEENIAENANDDGNQMLSF